MKVRRSRREPVKETQMVSLADIAFLIIFFFMLAATFMHDRTTVQLPKLPKAARVKSNITVVLDNNAQIFLDDQLVSTPDALESRLKDKLSGKTKSEDCEVRFKCDKNQRRKIYQPIFEAIANAGGVISVMHEVKK